MRGRSQRLIAFVMACVSCALSSGCDPVGSGASEPRPVTKVSSEETARGAVTPPPPPERDAPSRPNVEAITIDAREVHAAYMVAHGHVLDAFFVARGWGPPGTSDPRATGITVDEQEKKAIIDELMRKRREGKR